MNVFEQIDESLRPYRGWNISMWFYTASHSELVLQLRQPVEYEVKYLVLSGCGDICVPAESSIEDIHVEQQDALTWRLRMSGGIEVTAETWRLDDQYTIGV